LIVFGQRAGQFAARFAKDNSAGHVNADQVDEAARRALEPFERGAAGENPFAVQHELQETMQDLVGIVRQEEEMERAIVRIEGLKKRAERAGITGNREYNTGWHTALDLENLLTVSEIIALAGITRKESRGAHFREDYPEKSDKWAGCNLRIRKAPDGGVLVEEVPVKAPPAELQEVIEENK
jgi:succinate dehydrogenase / fumarate reductase flavoprotein subunit